MHNTKSKMSGMISKGFKPDKCKVSLRMAMARMKLLRNKREAQVKQMRRDVAQLLESGQDQTARIRVEHVIREEKTMAAYELIELYCELITARLPVIDSQKNCPIDLKEAIASVIFASPRCADVPELMDVRKQFVSKFGKDFTACALELRPGSGVSPLIIEKLSARAPDIETKIKALTSIAEEHNINWDSKELLEQLQKPTNDLLSGSTHFPSASNFQASFAPQNNESNENILHQQNDIPPQEYSSPENVTPNISAPLDPHFELNSFDSELREEEKTEHKYKDAQAAARAAAESAERAHMAAKAAAELANRKNIKSDAQNIYKKEETNIDLSAGESSSVGVFDQYDSDHDDHSVFEPYKKTNLLDSFSPAEKKEEYYSSSGFSSHKADADESLFSKDGAKDSYTPSHFPNSSSAPTYDSDGFSSDNENEKKLESLTIYEEEEKEEQFSSRKEPAQISYDDDGEVELGFNFGKLTGGLKNKPQRLPLYVRKLVADDDDDGVSSDKRGYADADADSDSSSSAEDTNEALTKRINDKKKTEEESSSDGSAALHVHPRLPSDYDSFAAHFHSL